MESIRKREGAGKGVWGLSLVNLLSIYFANGGKSSANWLEYKEYLLPYETVDHLSMCLLAICKGSVLIFCLQLVFLQPASHITPKA